MLPELDYEWINSEEFKKELVKVLDNLHKACRELEKSKQLTPAQLLDIWVD